MKIQKNRKFYWPYWIAREELFTEDPYEVLTVDDISKGYGISKSTVYASFHASDFPWDGENFIVRRGAIDGWIYVQCYKF